VSALKKVSGAADLAAAESGLKHPPAAFVLPLEERPGGNERDSGTLLQRNVVRFAVLLAVSNLRDAAGEQAQADLRALRPLVMGALIGWQPGASWNPLEFGGGRLLYLADRLLWWRDEFVTANYLEN
jgi:hypothetical protein